MGPEGYIEIDMDGDDGLIDAMTYDEWIAQPETTWKILIYNHLTICK